MTYRLPFVAVILFVTAKHVVLALENANWIEASKTVPSDSTQTTRVAYRRITGGFNERFLRQLEKKPGVNDKRDEERANFFEAVFKNTLFNAFGYRSDAKAKLQDPNSNIFVNLLRRIFVWWAKNKPEFNKNADMHKEAMV
uniref:Secreted RxLR effector protein 37 n=1 Tax=Plasmopara viticola TaxID=143451 RepID=RLR37_PLAVT|nr:RecName: Full=Secreted RxLR effector protein 37; Flags: Precursor [Plasmopara viticola]